MADRLPEEIWGEILSFAETILPHEWAMPDFDVIRYYDGTNACPLSATTFNTINMRRACKLFNKQYKYHYNKWLRELLASE
jgi:hypothetical protein